MTNKTLGSSDKIDSLGSFVSEFGEKILGTQIIFLADDTYLRDWEPLLKGKKEELIEKVKAVYSIDISEIYDKKIFEILTDIKNKIDNENTLSRSIK